MQTYYDFLELFASGRKVAETILGNQKLQEEKDDEFSGRKDSNLEGLSAT
jgi:hypothetical protein